MLKLLKNYIKTKPIIYDRLNSMRPITGEVAIWLDKFSKENAREVCFIQVGANDGLRWDPLRRFILKNSWKGVLIEPVSPVFELLKANYAYVKRCDLSFENCVISTGSDSVDFWTYSEKFLRPLSIEKQLYYLRKSSLDKEAVERNIMDSNERNEMLACYRVPCFPLSAIIQKYCLECKLDLVFIDAEGHDDDVIRSIDFSKCTPKAICYESHNLGRRDKEIKTFLESKGYTVTQLAGDTVAEIAA